MIWEIYACTLYVQHYAKCVTHAPGACILHETGRVTGGTVWHHFHYISLLETVCRESITTSVRYCNHADNS